MEIKINLILEIQLKIRHIKLLGILANIVNKILNSLISFINDLKACTLSIYSALLFLRHYSKK
tara:strand:+ start:151 stop:339 length:189 start_codon:yes stop_codon:yes gene_type:complete